MLQDYLLNYLIWDHLLFETACEDKRLQVQNELIF